MMNLAKKIAKIFSLIFFVFLLSSCDKGCVEADQFDGNYFSVNSNPGASSITGNYSGETDENSDVVGGQQIDWTDTALRSNGEQFVIQITGSWTPWFGSSITGDAFNNLGRCNFCAKKEGADNCLCYRNQIPEPEVSSDGYTRVDANCSGSDQDDKSKCTCTKNYGVATSYTTYHIPLNYENKSGSVLDPSDQDVCKYDSGMGLYLGLFGKTGNETPTRVYHLFTEDSVCDIALDSNGECKDESGVDATKYIFRSSNSSIFVKDDNNNNNTDNDYFGNGATLHSSNERVKLIVYDSYYLDNNGGYNVNFFKGVGKANDAGLLEYLVGLVEDTVLGKIDSDTCVEIDSTTGKKSCQREGGIIKYLYLSIVQDSLFITVLQILLSMYIAFYGLATLIGLAAITKKDLMNRTLKISLIIFFTSPTSWSFYNDIVISFFKDSMDYVVGMFMDISDGNLNDENSSILMAQMERAVDTSNATRFSFIDLTIKKLLSLAAAKKIFGLFFGSYFGILYIPAIYFLISYFMYVTLVAATFYLVNVMKLIFLLALGPVFMCFSLFSQTNGMFKKWISFLGSRSLEILILFMFLYNFIAIIDREFVSLLYYRSCVEMWGIPFMKIPVLKSNIDRSLISWLADIVSIGGLIFIMQMVVNQIPTIAGALISIGGESNDSGRAKSSMDLANKIMGGSKDEYGVYNVAGKAKDLFVGSAKFSAGAAVQGGTQVYRSLANSSLAKSVSEYSFGKTLSAINESLPNSPRTRYRNQIIDGAINEARAEAVKKGLSGVKADAFIRSTALSKLQTKMYRNYSDNKSDGPKIFDPTGMKIAGVNMTTIVQRFDEVLVKKALKEFIKEESRNIANSSDPVFGKEKNERIKQNALQWAEKNLSGGKEIANQYLDGLDDFAKKQSQLTTSEAAEFIHKSSKALAAGKDDVEAAEIKDALKNKYLQHLQDNELSLNERIERNKKRLFGIRHGIGVARSVYSSFARNEENNPEKQREIFLRKLEKRERIDKRNEEISKLRGLDVITKGFSFGHARDVLTGDLVFGRWFDNNSGEKITKDQLNSLREAIGDRRAIIERDKGSVKENYKEKLSQLDSDLKFLNNTINDYAKKIKANENNRLELEKKLKYFEKEFQESKLLGHGKQENLKNIDSLKKEMNQNLEDKKSLEKTKEALNKKLEQFLNNRKTLEESIKKEEEAIDARERIIFERRSDYLNKIKETLEKDIDQQLKKQRSEVLLNEAKKRLNEAKENLNLEAEKNINKVAQHFEKIAKENEQKLREIIAEKEKLKAGQDADASNKILEIEKRELELNKTKEVQRLQMNLVQAQNKYINLRKNSNINENEEKQIKDEILKAKEAVLIERADLMSRKEDFELLDNFSLKNKKASDVGYEKSINEAEHYFAEIAKENERKLRKTIAEKEKLKAGQDDDASNKILEIEKKEFGLNKAKEVQRLQMNLVQAQKKYINLRKNSNISEDEEKEIQDQIAKAEEAIFIKRADLMSRKEDFELLDEIINNEEQQKLLTTKLLDGTKTTLNEEEERIKYLETLSKNSKVLTGNQFGDFTQESDTANQNLGNNSLQDLGNNNPIEQNLDNDFGDITLNSNIKDQNSENANLLNQDLNSQELLNQGEEDLKLQEIVNQREEDIIKIVLNESELRLAAILEEKNNLESSLKKIFKIEFDNSISEVNTIAEIIQARNSEADIDYNNQNYKKYEKMSSENLKEAFDIIVKLVEIEQKQISVNKIYDAQISKMSLIKTEKKYIDLRKKTKNIDKAEEIAIEKEILEAKEDLFIARSDLLIDQNKYVELIKEEISEITVSVNQSIVDKKDFEERKKRFKKILKEIHDNIEEFEKNKDLAEELVKEPMKNNSKSKEDHSALKDVYNLNKEYILAKAKLVKLNLSIKKEELRSLKTKDSTVFTADEKIKISSLEEDIASLENQSQSYSSEASEIESRIIVLDTKL